MSNREVYKKAVAKTQQQFRITREDDTFPHNTRGAWAKHYKLWDLPGDFQYLPPGLQKLLYGMAYEGHDDLLSQIQPIGLSVQEFKSLILANCRRYASIETDSPVRVASADASASTPPAEPVSASAAATAGAAKQEGWPCRPEGAQEGVDLFKVGVQLADMAEGVVTPLVEKAVAAVSGFRRAA